MVQENLPPLGNELADKTPAELLSDDPEPPAPLPIPQAEPTLGNKPDPAKAEPVKLIPAKGKIEFHASVTKTINGSTTEKKYTTARSVLSELSQLERRQKENDPTLEQLRILLALNANVFEYSEAQAPRELVAALDEAIPQNIQAEEIFAKLEYLNPGLANHPPISLSKEESERISSEVQRIYSASYKVLQTQMIFGRSLLQDDVDKFQFLFEQECQKIKGIPERYSLPKFRVRLPSFGPNNPGGSQSYEGDAERFKEQTPRGNIIKRIAVALNGGTLIKADAD